MGVERVPHHDAVQMSEDKISLYIFKRGTALRCLNPGVLQLRDGENIMYLLQDRNIDLSNSQLLLKQVSKL